MISRWNLVLGILQSNVRKLGNLIPTLIQSKKQKNYLQSQWTMDTTTMIQILSSEAPTRSSRITVSLTRYFQVRASESLTEHAVSPKIGARNSIFVRRDKSRSQIYAFTDQHDPRSNRHTWRRPGVNWKRMEAEERRPLHLCATGNRSRRGRREGEEVSSKKETPAMAFTRRICLSW